MAYIPYMKYLDIHVTWCSYNVCGQPLVHQINYLYFISQIFEHVTAIGLNEQELTFLNEVKGGPEHAKMSGHRGQPIVHQINYLYFISQIFEHVTAIGLNEQELTFLNEVKGGPEHAKMSAHRGQPLVHQVGYFDSLKYELMQYDVQKGACLQIN